jgi:hypothetical protein
MPVPEFAWKSYEIPLRSTEALTAAAEQKGQIQLPDLSPWPGPLEKAQVLLQTAAEVEHALLVQYLYAAFSLNKDLPDNEQKGAVKSWRDTVIEIARQEMGHLMTVQNLLLTLGFLPSLEREDFPPRKDLYPFTLHLEPLSHRSLAKYVAAESPADAKGIEDILELATTAEGATVNRVGTIYGLLAFLFSAGDVAETGNSIWDDMMNDIAATLKGSDSAKWDPAAWHLPDSAIGQHNDSDARQCDPSDWPDACMSVYKITSRESALKAIHQIAAEGEGQADSDDEHPSHFSRFRDMFRGKHTLPFPAAGQWMPTLKVPTDPRTKDIDNERTKLWTQLADLRYGMLLEAIEHYLRTADKDVRRRLASWAISEDMYDLGRLAQVLVTLPLEACPHADPPVAGLPFTMPLLPLPDTEEARWEIHRERSGAAIAKIKEIRDNYPADADNDVLTKMLEFLQARDDPGQGTSFARDIRPLFRPIDVDHMLDRVHIDLTDYDKVKDKATAISQRIKLTDPRQRMPPDVALTPPQIDLFDAWIHEEFPP